MADEWVLRLAGAALLAALAAELFVTTLTLRGAGAATGRGARLVWRILMLAHRRRPIHGALQYAGGLIAALTLIAWVLTLWLGWGLIFAGAPGGVVDTQTGAPADLWSRIYFAGFNIFTLGLGDYRPAGDGWQIVTALASASGLLGITLTITYLVPVLSAAVHRQGLAAQISLLGLTPQEVARRACASPESAAAQLSDIIAPLLELSRQHRAYPILHYFHERDRRLAAPLRIAVLHEGLLLAQHGLNRAAPRPAEFGASLEAIGVFLDAIAPEVANASNPPPPAALEDLAGLDLALQSQARFESALEPYTPARKRLCGFVEHDGWRWDDVAGRPSPEL